LHRLEQIKGLLKSRDHLTVPELAGELGISLRTATRDLAVLRSLDVPIEADRGRGGGIRLQANWALGRLHLGPGEAIGLLLSLTIAEQVNSPLLTAELAAVRRKVAFAFAESYQRQIRGLRSRVRIGEPASEAVRSAYRTPPRQAMPAIAEAFFRQRLLYFDYRSGDGRISQRRAEPQLLCLNLPVWYLLAWDLDREAPRTFRIDRIGRTIMSETSFRLRSPAEMLDAHGVFMRSL
jgi:predicted DNA-binding transcriptional regulator YafY